MLCRASPLNAQPPHPCASSFQAKVFEEAEATAAKYQERLEAERKARDEAAQDVIFGLESVFTDSPTEGANEELPLEK